MEKIKIEFSKKYEFMKQGKEYYILDNSKLLKLVSDYNIKKNEIEDAVYNNKFHDYKPVIIIYTNHNIVDYVDLESIKYKYLINPQEKDLCDIPKKSILFIFQGKGALDSSIDRVFCKDYIQINYFYTISHIYRTSVYWEKSGRPCPRCVLLNHRYSLGNRSLDSSNLREMGIYIDNSNLVNPSLGESLYIIYEILKFADTMLLDNYIFQENIVNAEIISRSSLQRQYMSYPVYPKCNHN